MDEVVDLSEGIPRPLTQRQWRILRDLYSNNRIHDAIILPDRHRIEIFFSDMEGDSDASAAIDLVLKTLYKKTGEERGLIEQIEKLQGLGADKSNMLLKAQQDKKKAEEALETLTSIMEENQKCKTNAKGKKRKASE
jgi:hypothetical protein